jgi:hypothetical protein
MKNKLFVFVLMVILFIMAAGCAPGTVIQIGTPVPNTSAGTPAPSGQITVPGLNLEVNLPGSNPLVNKADAHGHVATILMGIWHGIISPITLVVSFANPDVQMYEVHNDGSQYNLGFLIGVAIVFIVLGALAGSRR